MSPLCIWRFPRALHGSPHFSFGAAEAFFMCNIKMTLFQYMQYKKKQSGKVTWTTDLNEADFIDADSSYDEFQASLTQSLVH